MKKYFVLILISLSLFLACENNREPITAVEKEKYLENAISQKYSLVKNFYDLKLAFDLFAKEDLELRKDQALSQFFNNYYRYREEIYLIELLLKYIEKHPKEVIPRIISLGQYAGAADSEYIRNVLSKNFFRNPEIFVKNINKEILFTYLMKEFRDDRFINGTYNGISEPLFDDFDAVQKESLKQEVIKKISKFNVKSDFFDFLRKKYEF
jgi:hypothetical protein